MPKNEGKSVFPPRLKHRVKSVKMEKKSKSPSTFLNCLSFLLFSVGKALQNGGKVNNSGNHSWKTATKAREGKFCERKKGKCNATHKRGVSWRVVREFFSHWWWVTKARWWEKCQLSHSPSWVGGERFGKWTRIECAWPCPHKFYDQTKLQCGWIWYGKLIKFWRFFLVLIAIKFNYH